MPVSSRIFLKNRALGYVSNHVPCVIRYSKRRDEYLISTCVGKAFHTYGSSHLSLLSVSDTVAEDITCMSTDSEGFYTASGPVIHSWKRNAVIKHTFNGHSHPVHTLLPFGDHLVSIDEGNILKLWGTKTQENVMTIEFGTDTFKITSIVHPSTYVNKFLLGSEQGQLQIWNLKTSKLVHTFNGWGCAVTVLEQSPALDVIAVGLNDGKIILHNIKYDETVIDFKQDWGPVSSISFRTDNVPIMVTGSSNGHIVIWNLEEKKVASQIIEAHRDSVASMICIPREPIMVTSSPDNSLKMWMFDQPDFSGRLFKLREGHAKQPNCVRFYHPHHILSAGKDSSLRVFNTVSESMNYSLGKASYNKNKVKNKKWKSSQYLMPQIKEFVFCTTREKDWDNIAALHKGIPAVSTWTYDKRKFGSHVLLPEKLKHQNKFTAKIRSTCAFITNCGNFIVIGYSSGDLERFNIQSGIHRCTYGTNGAHKGAVRGVAVDSLNQTVISACNAGILKVWRFKPERGSVICANKLAAITLDDGASFFRMHGESSLIAVVLENFSVQVLDIEARKIVRKMTGHTDRVMDAAFSPDARWIITSSVDRTIRVWDIPTGHVIDIFKVDSPCISLSFSPTGNYLATIHVDNVGIFLWSNKTLFSHVSLKPIKDPENLDVPLLELPGTGVESTVKLDGEENDEEEEYLSLKQIGDLITMSELSTSRWKHLLDLDLIKKRNKPKEPPKAPPSAPFFLPTLPGKDIVFDFSSVTAEDGVKTVKLSTVKNYTVFGHMLDKADINNLSPVIEKLKSMSPSGLDFEITSLGLDAQGSNELLLKFISVLKYMLSTNRDFELAQAYLGVFVKTHGKALTEDSTLFNKLESLKEAQCKGWDRIENDIMFCLNTINILKN